MATQWQPEGNYTLASVLFGVQEYVIERAGSDDCPFSIEDGLAELFKPLLKKLNVEQRSGLLGMLGEGILETMSREPFPPLPSGFMLDGEGSRAALFPGVSKDGRLVEDTDEWTEPTLTQVMWSEDDDDGQIFVRLYPMTPEIEEAVRMFSAKLRDDHERKKLERELMKSFGSVSTTDEPPEDGAIRFDAALGLGELKDSNGMLCPAWVDKESIPLVRTIHENEASSAARHFLLMRTMENMRGCFMRDPIEAIGENQHTRMVMFTWVASIDRDGEFNESVQKLIKGLNGSKSSKDPKSAMRALIEFLESRSGQDMGITAVVRLESNHGSVVMRFMTPEASLQTLRLMETVGGLAFSSSAKKLFVKADEDEEKQDGK